MNFCRNFFKFFFSINFCRIPQQIPAKINTDITSGNSLGIHPCIFSESILEFLSRISIGNILFFQEFIQKCLQKRFYRIYKKNCCYIICIRFFRVSSDFSQRIASGIHSRISLRDCSENSPGI